ncbi:hypothetical protein HK102_007356 [Quaeritorhiza haematococci]|nr:hypothetical protein HK102_007356 [Quaeritorhiza haematococci]
MTFAEEALLNHEPKCNRCLASKRTKKLLACRDCKMLACCEDRWPLEAKEHKKHCKTYLTAWQVDLTVLDYYKREGKATMTYFPDSIVAPYKSSRFPKSWDEYFTWRKFPTFVEPARILMTTTLSQILTIAAAIHFFYPTTWNTLTELRIHLIEAKYFEFSVSTLHEELLHIFPSVRKVDKELDGDACTLCNRDGRTRSWSFDTRSYHAFMAAHKMPPTIAVAFNSGIECNADVWEPIINCVVEKKIPMVLTTYNKEEAEDDQDFLERLGLK